MLVCDKIYMHVMFPPLIMGNIVKCSYSMDKGCLLFKEGTVNDF